MARPAGSVLTGFEDTIEKWLVEDQRRPRKQRHTAKRVFDRLVAEQAFLIGLTGQLIRRARVRSERLRLRVSSETLLVTVFWSPALWERLGFCRPRAVVMELHAQRAEVGVS